MERSWRNVHSIHVMVGPEPQCRKQEREEVSASWVPEQDEWDVWDGCVRTAKLHMSRSLGLYSLPYQVASDSVLTMGS